MKYFPTEDIIYQTKHSPKEILNRLQENLEPEKTFRRAKIFGNNTHKLYEGNIQGNIFSIRRIIIYTNTFPPPRITGVVIKDTQSTRINVKMRLPTLILIFLILWCAGVGFAFLVTLGMSISGFASGPIFLIPLLMMILGYGVITWGFKYESTPTKNQLAEMFEATIEKE